ncbi:MAG: DUF4037 domain-containing protein [Treponema sp.]|nr:DUF4037 domain-containing protein [Treponema sp.]
MKYKTRLLVERYSDILSQWPCVECITLNEAAMPDTLDPYFAVILDIFVSGPIPDAEERLQVYGDDVIAFESSGKNEKDRFLIGDIPLRLEYKNIKKIEELITIADSNTEYLWLAKDSITYSFYRLANGEIFFSRGKWIENIRKRLNNISDNFWEEIRMVVQSKMEHFLSDLGASSFLGDQFHYLLASSGFIKTACLALFCINRRFEPSHRAYYKQVLDLPLLPDSFRAQLENFLTVDPGTRMEQRFTLAKLIARGIVKL